MTGTKTDYYLFAQAKNFEKRQLPEIRSHLDTLNEREWRQVMSTRILDPVMILIISLLVGCLGIDRFMLGQVGLGVLKLVTLGGLGLWTLIDFFIIMSATRERNRRHLERALNQ